jgi:hypothetical protein
VSFLAPLFLVALAGLAIPVLLHLTQREKKQIVHFPSLMFVRRIPYSSVRRRKLQNLLLLAIRMTALALIIAAFARPLLTRPDAPVAIGQGARELVVLLDTSYSMGYGDRWARAQSAARDALRQLGPSDRGSVVLFASAADIAQRSTAEVSALTAAVDNAKPGSGATRYAPAIKVANSLLADSQLPRREVVLISDFQRTGWQGAEGTALPPGATLTPVAVQGGSDRPNVTVTAASLARSTFANQERVVVTAGLTNHADAPVSGLTLTLDMNGLSVGTRPVTLAAGASGSVSFEPVTVGQRNMRGTLRVSEDALAADNVRHFVLSPADPLRVTLVDRGGGNGLYVARALSIGEAPKFDTVTKSPDALSDDDLRRSAVVVLNDVPVSAALARRLARYVEGGGGLLVAAGQRASWPSDVEALPASIGAPVDRTRGPAARITGLELGHAVFEAFRAPRSGDFSSTRVYGYRQVAAVADAQVLARFDGGAPAVLEKRLGAGRVLLWSSTLDQSWTDLPMKPVFLPFLHRAATYLASYVPPQPSLTVGQVLDPTAAGARKGQAPPRVLLTPAGRRVDLTDEGAEVLELAEAGFYELRGEGNEAAVVAANVDPAEADPTPIDPAEIVSAASGGAPGAGATANSTPLTPEAREKSQRIWWYLLFAGVLLLGLDTLVSNRLAKA